MIGGELFPFLSGIVLGSLAALTKLRHHRGVMAVFICLAALVATIGSGEYKVSWAYFLIDLMIVLAAASVSFAVMLRVRWAQ
jgi:hypothetical protein